MFCFVLFFCIKKGNDLPHPQISYSRNHNRVIYFRLFKARAAETIRLVLLYICQQIPYWDQNGTWICLTEMNFLCSYTLIYLNHGPQTLDFDQKELKYTCVSSLFWVNLKFSVLQWGYWRHTYTYTLIFCLMCSCTRMHTHWGVIMYNHLAILKMKDIQHYR